jgi:formylglycine-generating enzyme required for sulfatase activity
LVVWLSAFDVPSGKPEAFKPYKEQLDGSALGFEMTPINGGAFVMGDDSGHTDESPAHEVKVGDFWMGTYEITWEQYQLFSESRNNHPNADKGDEVALEVDAIASATTPYVDMSHGMGKNGYPVVNVTQYAALTFCKWLSAKTGRFYRLPTEAEWEYACRAGTDTDYSFGNDTTVLADYGWYKGNSAKHYHKVGQKAPNPFGLYDMHGNVSEWTMDQYDKDSYAQRKGALVENPWRVPEKLYPRTVRGGSWQDTPDALRSSAREGSHPRWKRIDPQIPKSRWWFTNAPHVGFRIVRPRITPSAETIETYWLTAIDDF